MDYTGWFQSVRGSLSSLDYLLPPSLNSGLTHKTTMLWADWYFSQLSGLASLADFCWATSSVILSNWKPPKIGFSSPPQGPLLGLRMDSACWLPCFHDQTSLWIHLNAVILAHNTWIFHTVSPVTLHPGMQPHHHSWLSPFPLMSVSRSAPGLSFYFVSLSLTFPFPCPSISEWTSPCNPAHKLPSG